MATNISRPDLIVPASERSGLSWPQRMILRRLHPVAIICDVIGLMWATYFLWNQNWQAALAAAIVPRIIGLSIARHAKVDLLAQTVLGKIALLHLNPVNIAVQSAGVVVVIWGVWTHATQVILGGMSLIVVGHALGWEKVHRALELEQEL